MRMPQLLNRPFLRPRTIILGKIPATMQARWKCHSSLLQTHFMWGCEGTQAIALLVPSYSFVLWAGRLSNCPTPPTSSLSPWTWKWRPLPLYLAVGWSTWSPPCWVGSLSSSLGSTLYPLPSQRKTKNSFLSSTPEWFLAAWILSVNLVSRWDSG